MARYYHRREAHPDLALIYRNLVAAGRAFMAAGSLARAAEVGAILDELMIGYKDLSIKTAVEADEFIRKAIDQTRKRPPATGAMSRGIVSRPLAGANLPAGEVGIADLNLLDASGRHRPLGRRGIPYWMAQEFGSTAAVGRIVPGYFGDSPTPPGSSRPDAGQSRLHPFFHQVGPKAPRGTPAMLVQQPIEARHFLRDGTRDAMAQWEINSRAIDRTAIARIGRA